MKCVILAGGYGTRISEETHLKPKPMIEIGGKPIIWHIMKIYSNFGINEFIVCCGYKGYMIKEYFANYFYHTSDITFDLSKKESPLIHNNSAEKWKVTLIDTGQETETAGRLLKVREFLNEETFFFTYGDGLCNVNILNLFELHKKNKSKVTLTAVQPPGRFGALDIKENRVNGFVEKPAGDKSWVNGGFFVVQPEVLNLIKDSLETWESDILPSIAKSGDLGFFKHYGFWQCMDTLRDKNTLENLWKDGKAPWKLW
mgnify:CR=1 FL=1|tara:strand:+ start:170 stop:940 length:771 start_codon:yes stop_codon:yes gene_type:complete